LPHHHLFLQKILLTLMILLSLAKLMSLLSQTNLIHRPFLKSKNPENLSPIPEIQNEEPEKILPRKRPALMIRPKKLLKL